MKCFYVGCNAETKDTSLINGKPYCTEHYTLILKERFFESYASCNENGDAPDDLRYNFSRYVSHIYNDDFPGALSTARIRDRGVEYIKTNDGLTFEVIRHPGAWTRGGGTEKKQSFFYDIEKEELLLVSEEDTGVPFKT